MNTSFILTVAQPSWQNNHFYFMYQVYSTKVAPLLWSNTTTMRPLRIHFGGERNVKSNEIVEIQQQHAAASSSKQSSTICLEEPAEKREKTYSVVQEQVRVSRHLVRITWRVPSTTNHEQTWGGACCKRPWQRGTDASLTSSVLSRRATSVAPAQRKKYRYSSISSRWDHEKQISYFGDPQTGEVYTY